MSLAAYFASARTTRGSLLSRYGDLALVAGVVVIVALMVLPLPPLLVDVLVATNICSGVVLLLVAIYVRSPLEFSVFPSVLLITTLFRLALSIATTRMILLEAHAGHIIDTFGRMVAGGNLVVGLVVFLIITVVQFIVIAKGAERVAEVAARFTLDAMPGKQLSIDSDLRSGVIDKDEARRRRRELELESKLHGSLDGAMKFVKGDAIASIVIVVVNVLGGLAIGVLQKDMTLAGAMHTYSILTIGEGLVAQIPALLGAMSAGLLVTRATDEERDRHLGDAIGRQVAAKPRVLLVAGGLCVLLAAVPGFPALVFLGLAAVLLGGGALLTPALRSVLERRLGPTLSKVPRREAAAPGVLSTAAPEPRPAVPLLLELPQSALDAASARALVDALSEVLDRFQLQLGLLLPRIAVHPRPAEAGAPAGWRLLAFEVPIAEGVLPPAPLPAALAEACHQALRRHAALFLGTQETGALLARAGSDYPDVVKEALRALPLARLAEILRRLVEEEVPIRNLRDVLEALADAAQREKDVFALTEMARIALRRQTSHRAAPDGVLRAVLLTPEFEDRLRAAVRVANGQSTLALDPADAQAAMQRLAQAVRTSRPAALLTAVDLRRHVRKLVEAECFDTPVLSYHELMPTLRLEVLARVGDEPAVQLEAA
ncbi:MULTISPECIES: flagellar biosynthesis protein FlhA [Rubrivivax]|uniref:Type III secretion protein n=1 Tax=Rubrivivax benzoatilyticus TaxID=316997 RepID=A0ABX0HP17_9BURK|nr:MULTISPECIES: flagellar biosynthesis protein FlhA [Rubrivivax]EGJ10890.1 putative type III secretion pore protein [Rubrivivax benzoatilyticus JA2 = ATCC BAA-35]NHK96815.1 type III secretion protein [Rubrivivax benzoatilyticus]NHL24530.1 type III secretion protein [Rubrivivax benzoatilyticus]